MNVAFIYEVYFKVSKQDGGSHMVRHLPFLDYDNNRQLSSCRWTAMAILDDD